MHVGDAPPLTGKGWGHGGAETHAAKDITDPTCRQRPEKTTSGRIHLLTDLFLEAKECGDHAAVLRRRCGHPPSRPFESAPDPPVVRAPPTPPPKRLTAIYKHRRHGTGHWLPMYYCTACTPTFLDSPPPPQRSCSCLATTHQFAVRKGQAPPSEVTDELVALAAQALHGNRYVTFLDLSYGTASVKGCHALTQILDHKSVLETIRLRHNCINDEGARALVDAAHRAPALTTLDIEGNDLVSDAMRRRIALAVALNTQPNAVKTAVLKIRQGDNSAKMLRLCVPDGGRYCDDTTCEILEHYYRETGMAVQRLDLSNNVITDVGVRVCGGRAQRPPGPLFDRCGVCL